MENMHTTMEQSPTFQKVLKKVTSETEVNVSGLWGGSLYFVFSALCAQTKKDMLFITDSLTKAEIAVGDFSLFFDGEVLLFSPWERIPGTDFTPPADIFQNRLKVIEILHNTKERPHVVVVAPVQALLQPVVNERLLRQNTKTISVGEELPVARLSEWLTERDFTREHMVEKSGQFSVRGGIVDIFPYNMAQPLRVEFFGDAVESLRFFNPFTQRSTDEINRIDLYAFPHREFVYPDSEHAASVVSYFDENSLAVLSEPLDIQENAAHYLDTLPSKKGFINFAGLYEAIRKRTVINASTFPGPREEEITFQTKGIDVPSRDPSVVKEYLECLIDSNEYVAVFCNNPAEMERFREMFASLGETRLRKLREHIGYLSEGFIIEEIALAVLSHSELFKRYRDRRPVKKNVQSQPIDTFVDIEKGDYVVHTAHGIAIFRGIKTIQKHGSKQEFLVLEFDGGAYLYVPCNKSHLVQRYIGVFDKKPRLSVLGTTSWEKKKQRVSQAVGDLALELLQLQAKRALEMGTSFPGDDDWQQEFEHSFIYQETEDQLVVMDEIKNDMVSHKPMDRLICGDVGYGKTELAMRAAFKAVNAGKQVAVLVPTTVLAEQHYRTFTERMAEYPFVIEVLSRFKTKSEQKKILERLERGSVDIVIGTHRLLQKDVAFKDLGLLIIDEEQRFGVKHKEYLRKARQTIDVLTMTATPIPRTLHMSLLGLKDISALETPPQDRFAIRSEVCRFDRDKIRNAIMRELTRGGQVFFVHNRVYNINRIADEVVDIVPEATVAVAHGQMSEHMLEKRMFDFINSKINVLVATTIIENGLDIPNANTIFVNESDQYGLAALHQLRGRVGRYNRHAYAYFLLPRKRPVSPIARKRLKAIEDYSELGSGFKIALRDLEIRGAGNILGPEQSGHIASVGYEMYCRLLEKAIRKLRNEDLSEPVNTLVEIKVDSYIPDEYIYDDRDKMEVYRTLSRAFSIKELQEAVNAMRDRFGPLPKIVKILLRKHIVRIYASQLEVASIILVDDHLVFQCANMAKITEALRKYKDRLRFVDEKTVHFVLPEGVAKEGLKILEYLEKILNAPAMALDAAPVALK